MKIFRVIVLLAILTGLTGCQTTFTGNSGKVSPNSSQPRTVLSGTIDGRAWQNSLGIAQIVEDDGPVRRMRLQFYEGYEFAGESDSTVICDARRLKPKDVEIVVNAPLLIGSFELPSDEVQIDAISFTFRTNVEFMKDLDTGTSGGVGTEFIGSPVTGKLTINAVEEKTITGELIASGEEKSELNTISGPFQAFVCPKKH